MRAGLLLVLAWAAFTCSFGAPAAHAAPGQHVVAVLSTSQWTSTGIHVRAGESIVVSASGTVKFRARANSVGPEGVPWGIACERANLARIAAPWPLSRVACWSLIGRIGNGRPFEVGRSATVRAANSGELQLGINDNYIADNAGSWNASVSVTPSAPAPSPLATPKHGSSSAFVLVIIGFIAIAVIAGLVLLVLRSRRREPGEAQVDQPEAAADLQSAQSSPTHDAALPLLPTADDETVVPSEHDATKVNIFEVALTTSTLRVGYSHFPESVKVDWSIRRGLGDQAVGSFVTNGGGDTAHYVTFPVEIAPEDGRGTSVYFQWSIDDVPFAYSVRRDPVEAFKA